MKISCWHVSKILVISGFFFQNVPCEQRCLSGMGFSINTKWFARIVSRVVEGFLSGMALSKQPHYATDNSREGEMLKAIPKPLLAGYPKSKES